MKNKKNITLMAIGAITLILVTLGATYAYFVAQSGGGANIDTNVITGTTDNLSFSFGDLININATEENFGQGMGSISDSTTATAVLKANNTTNEATAKYNIYLIIESNDFVYTTEEGTPEIVLNVTDPNGMEVENITGLVHYENGFDITTRTGGFLLVPDYEITATTAQTIQDWNIEVTLVNLDSDQNDNTGKTLTGKLYLTQDQMSSYELTEINNIETTTTYNSIDATLDLTNGSGEVSKYYYGIEETSATRSAETVEYTESDSANYEFTNLESNTEYTIYSYVVDENKIKSNVYQTNITTDEYDVPTIDNVSHSVTLNSITLNVTASNGSNEITKYMYSKDNGSSWEESTSNTYTFSGLTDSTEYKIKVKVVDSEGYESTEYYEAITTEVYILPVVSNVNATTTWNSITLTPTGTNGTNTISKYMYSINGGSYQESNVFSGLTDNTRYTIKVKAIDSIGRESNEYKLNAITEQYVLPIISNVTTSSTGDSITINVSALNGTGNVVEYYYSRDNGSNYIKSTNNSYTFTNLTDNTTFYIKVYVVDNNNKNSNIYNITEKTSINLALITLNKLGLSKNTDIPNFNLTSCTAGSNIDGSSCGEETVGVYSAADDFGTSYYFRGDVENNYVKFADFYWRIIRINGDGTIRMIYDGTTPHYNGEKNTDRSIGTSKFTEEKDDNAYAGYMYGAAQSEDYISTHANLNNSTIKKFVDNWYEINILNKGYSMYVADAIYCNDRSISKGNAYGSNSATYAAYDRLRFATNNKPQLTCNQINDRFSVAENINDLPTNGDLKYPVGLITADELVFAGGIWWKHNLSLYLSMGSWYWTMTPAYYHENYSYMSIAVSEGDSYIQDELLNGNSARVRPVISLKSSVNISGNGTISNPFVIY